ncbi:MAG: NUDIX hydrolase N-terminal domain-containing protein [Candidatus Odinarchaeota archaeon]
MNPVEQIVLWADTLRDISASGLLYSQNVYDRERYLKIQDIALAMLAFATNESLLEMEPLRAPIFSRPTPLIGGDAAIINEKGEILLIQRADNGKWAMPGGLLEVGETPAEGVLRETFEETGVRCRAVTLIGVFDSRLCGIASRHHIYSIMFLCKPLEGGKIRKHQPTNEVLDTHWFPENDLPVDIDPGHISRIPKAFRVWKGEKRVFFDEQG